MGKLESVFKPPRSTRALARLSDVAVNDFVPLARRFVSGAKAVVDGVANRTLGPDFEERASRLREHYDRLGGDPFGLDPDFTKYTAILGAVFHRWYFRTQVTGIENLPPGRCLLISNHSGQIPLDGMIIMMSVFMNAEPPRFARAMVEKWSQTIPFVGVFFARTGQVVGVPENCRLLLERDECILAFPEGVRGINKPFSRRYQLEEFGLGFMRLAMETNTPIVPVAVIGAEEQFINVGNLGWAARAFGLPSFPIVPQWFLPGGLMPLPTKYRIHFGEPLRFEGDPDDDDVVLEQKVWLVRQTIQSMLNRGLKDRSGVFT
jgi:1-acyl-sn-glycerol-3-phosphate acyltransferase